MEECVFRLTEAMGLLYNAPEERKACKQRALDAAEDIHDAPLLETVNLADKKADLELQNELDASGDVL